MAGAIPLLSLSGATVRASSVDTHQRLSYNPHRTYPKKPEPVLSAPATTISTKTAISISDLLKRDSSRSSSGVTESGDTYLGYERWLPSPPKVEKPRSAFNAASLAYIGDCIYELYARRHFLFPPLNIEEYNDRVMAVVRCEAQDEMLRKLIDDNYLSGEERDVLRWGKNIGSSKTRTKRRAGVAVYNSASSLETLIGYLYLTDVNRLEEIMLKLGFSTGASAQSIQEMLNMTSMLHIKDLNTPSCALEEATYILRTESSRAEILLFALLSIYHSITTHILVSNARQVKLVAESADFIILDKIILPNSSSIPSIGAEILGNINSLF